MSRSGGQSEARPPVYRSTSGGMTGTLTQGWETSGHPDKAVQIRFEPRFLFCAQSKICLLFFPLFFHVESLDDKITGRFQDRKKIEPKLYLLCNPLAADINTAPEELQLKLMDLSRITLPGQPIGVNVHCTLHTIREQSLSSQSSQKILKTHHPDEEHKPRLPDSIAQPITNMPLSRMENTTFAMPSIIDSHDMGLRTVYSPDAQKKTPIQ
ncbi:hypothetical protein TNCV_3599451 [Trichonephila clavipes]|nr:hypothetical protein TNCV_3599451 [Trichonephila clavipes]